ncbi:unnamed protein product, partial [Choristocarpus tenellus]
MDSEVTLEFMTGNPQLEVLTGRLKHSVTLDREGQERQADCILLSRRPASSRDSLPSTRGTLLCITSVPAHMVPTDIIQFVAPFKSSVHYVRILRPCNPIGPDDPARLPAEYMVMLKMESQESADAFFLQCNGKLFSSFEEARCDIVFVSSVTFDPHCPPPPAAPSATPIEGTSPVELVPRQCKGTSSTSSGGPERNEGVAATNRPSSPRACLARLSAPAAFTSVGASGGGGGGSGLGGGVGGGVGPVRQKESAIPWAYDAAVCVICMENMESQVLTTVCNHSFHIDCLVKWQDSPCPVCRFHHNNTGQESTCQECSSPSNLWVCLICGSVLCGPRHEDHARQHYTSVLHAYALEIETQQVWDFAGDGFVHRLIQNKADGKLVEVPDPDQTSGERPRVPAHLSDIQEEQLVHGKLEGLAYQYNTLLTSQLEEQRFYYQKQV